MRNLVLLGSALVLVAACKPTASTSDASAASASAPAAPASTPSAAPSAAAPIPPPNWMKGAPAKAVKAKVGDMVWAIIPSTYASDLDIGRMGIYKVDAINGTTASVSNAEGKHDVPGLFILPIGDATKLKVGDAVLSSSKAGWGFGRVVKNDKGKITTRIFLTDKTARDEPADVATALATGTGPFADVYYEKFPGKMYSGLAIAEEGGTSWILDHDSAFFTETKAKLQPLKWAFKDRKVGDKVTMFAGMGATDATITKVLDPKAFFEVNITGTTTSATYDQITDSKL